MRFVSIALVSLASVGSVLAQDLARIYVYAQRQTAARSWLPISCDSAVIAKLKRGTFFAINIAAGRHIINEENGIPVFVDARPGEESFIRLDWNFKSGRAPIPEFHLVRSTEARKELNYLTYIDANKVLSKLVSKSDPREPSQLRLKRRGESNE